MNKNFVRILNFSLAIFIFTAPFSLMAQQRESFSCRLMTSVTSYNQKFESYKSHRYGMPTKLRVSQEIVIGDKKYFFNANASAEGESTSISLNLGERDNFATLVQGNGTVALRISETEILTAQCE